MAKMGGLGKMMEAAAGGSRAPPPEPMGSVPVQGQGQGQAQGTRGMPFNVASGAVPQPNTHSVRREMRGPPGSNVDDVLKAFEAERAVQSGMAPGIAGVHATVFAPNGPPPTPPRNGREGVGTSSDPLAGLNIHEIDAQSVESGGTTNTASGAGRRGRRRAEPVGATLNLNV